MAAKTELRVSGLGAAHTVIHSEDSGEVWLGSRGCLLRMEGDRAVETRLLKSPLPGASLAQPSPALQRGLEQLAQYFQGQRRKFELDLKFSGPPFTVKVWEALRAIPYGETMSYGELAARAGSPGSARAVGSAMRRNPLVLFLPCHRVIASQGKLGGFSCGVEWKRYLLNLERGNTGLEFVG